MLPANPTIPIIQPYDEDEKEECIRPMDWLFSPEFIFRRFMCVN